LWTILFRGEPCRPYNVGSDRDVTIKQLANIVANIFDPARTIEIHKKPIEGQTPERYVPSIQRVSDKFNLAVHTDLTEAIERTTEWHKQGHHSE